MAAHFQPKHRHSQDKTNPETPRKISQFGRYLMLGSRLIGLQRHAADWTGPRLILSDLWMHLAGIGRHGADSR
jgi:hypothetical protein